MTNAWCDECFFLRLPVQKYRLVIEGDRAVCPHCKKTWPKDLVKTDGEA